MIVNRFIFSLLCSLILLSIQSPILAQDLYVKEILQERQEKDREFKSKDEGPFKKKKEIKKFKGLSYYDVDLNYRALASLVTTPDSKPFEIETSSGKKKAYRQYGLLHFNLNGKHLHAPVYQNLRLMETPGYENHLFFPFTDLSSGETTYPAGRYIDLQIPPGGSGQIVLDFNKCYNPYCAYSDGFSCPIPPPQNHLEIFISAGEKNYQKK